MRRVLGAASMLVMAHTALAVCLKGHPSVEKEFHKSWAVVVATVVEQHEVPEKPPKHLDGGTAYQLDVNQIYRGKVPQFFEVLSENNSGRFPMTVGAPYLLFVHRDSGAFEVSNCGNSGPLSKTNETREKLKSLAAKTDHTSAHTTRSHPGP